jgi:hypothetical protein
MVLRSMRRGKNSHGDEIALFLKVDSLINHMPLKKC